MKFILLFSLISVSHYANASSIIDCSYTGKVVKTTDGLGIRVLEVTDAYLTDDNNVEKEIDIKKCLFEKKDIVTDQSVSAYLFSDFKAKEIIHFYTSELKSDAEEDEGFDAIILTLEKLKTGETFDIVLN